MNAHKRQSRTPKPQPMDKQIERIRRDMDQLGFDTHIKYGTGRYSPKVTLEVWPKDERKSA